MAKTKTALATRALGILGIVQAGQTPAAEDLAHAEDLVDPLAAQLGLEGAIYVGDTSMIEDAVFLPLASRLALEIAPDFGLPAVDDSTRQAAERPLRRLAASHATYALQKATYF